MFTVVGGCGLNNKDLAGDDPAAVGELISFSAIHWRVARRCGVHPATLTRSHVARLVVEDTIAFEERCAGKGLPVAPRSDIDEAVLRARRFFRRCIENGQPPSAL